MTTYAYLFEAKSIQSYILATNRLKEIVGASELVESLTGSFDTQDALLDHALKAIDGEGKIQFSRKGGATFYAFSDDAGLMDKLATLWPLLVRQYAPDLEFADAHDYAETLYDAFDKTHKLLLQNRNRQTARLPQAGPFAIRNRRTGEPAVGYRPSQKAAQDEPVDAATYRKLNKKFFQSHQLPKRFAEDSGKDDWPTLLTPEKGQEGKSFPFIGESRTIALIHADGNGLGQALLNLKKHANKNQADYLTLFAGFSKAVTKATQQAAQNATEKVLLQTDDQGHRKLYPARPIVLGGDDLTIIVRADLALEFTRHFLEAFAKYSREELEALHEKFPFVPEQLTACAGIAYAKSSQPFYLLHGLAEGLCKRAKKHAKDWAKNQKPGVHIPSTLSFHRITTAMVDEYEDILDWELTVPGKPNSLCQTLHDRAQKPDLGKSDELVDFRIQTLQAYALEETDGLPWLDKLIALRDLLDDEDMARGPARQVLGLVGQDLEQAKSRYKRWREVMGSNEKTQSKLKEFNEILLSLLSGKLGNDLPYGKPIANKHIETVQTRATPLGDVITLLSIARG